uniref:GB1/RHD3-type G domain-containing protein n=1 Tax=Gopherus evgoodei TaxID=1825980 RepID=A0A8C4Y4M0_9SAUR
GQLGLSRPHGSICSLSPAHPRETEAHTVFMQNTKKIRKSPTLSHPTTLLLCTPCPISILPRPSAVGSNAAISPLPSPQGDTKNDTWIFALAVLLSGTLVYNSLGTIDQRALEQLHYVTELTERIKVKAAGEGSRQEGEDSAEFVRFFPAFVWAVRDFTLQLQLDGREITEDEYLENALKRRQGASHGWGPVLGNLAVTYVDAIRSGAVPCMESAVLALVQIENSAAVVEAVAAYEEQLGLRVVLPTESVQELLELHAQCEREALRVFLARAFKDEQVHWLRCPLSPQDKLDSKRAELCRQNEQASSDRCTAALLELSQELEERVCEGSYSVPGGYQRLLDDQREMVEKYQLVPEKGIMAAEVLQQFLKSKEMVAQAVLQTDQSLTDRQREIEAEREAQLSQEMQARTEQLLQDQKRSHQEHVQQLTAKMEQDRRQLLAEQERALALKLQEQERLLREGFQKEAAQLQHQMQNLRTEMSRPQGSCSIL